MADRRPSPYPQAILRRLLTIPLLLVSFVAVLVASPVLFALAGLVDLARRAWGWPTVRLVAFLLGYLGYEVVGICWAGWIWATQPLSRKGWIERNERLQMWWIRRLSGAARPILGLRLEIEADDGFSAGPLVVLSRHVSLVDALLPAEVFGAREHRSLRYTLTAGLQLDPCLDVVGHRLPDHFIDRQRGDGGDLAALEHLTEGMGPDDVAVIFPEGSLFSVAGRRRALEKVRSSDPARADRFTPLTTVLPPRPGGALAMLRGAPDADVAVLAHHGSEPLGSLRWLWRVAPLRRPVRLRITRHARADLPDEDGLAGWIDDQWATMHGWLAARPLEEDPP